MSHSLNPRVWMKEHSTGILPWSIQKTLKPGNGLIYTFMTYHEVWDWSESTTTTDFSLS